MKTVLKRFLLFICIVNVVASQSALPADHQASASLQATILASPALLSYQKLTRQLTRLSVGATISSTVAILLLLHSALGTTAQCCIPCNLGLINVKIGHEEEIFGYSEYYAESFITPIVARCAALQPCWCLEGCDHSSSAFFNAIFLWAEWTLSALAWCSAVTCYLKKAAVQKKRARLRKKIFETASLTREA
jgi:hypothetical protein